MFDFLGILTRAVLGLTPIPHAAPLHAPEPVPASTPAPVHAPVSVPVEHLATPAIPLAAAPAASPMSASQIVDNVQKFYANIKQVTAGFRQTVTNQTFGSKKTSGGMVWIMKPGKMRWDYREKKRNKVEVKKSFISNGTNLYVVEHDNMQVVKKNLKHDLMPVAVSFLYGKGDLKTEFNAAIDRSGKFGDKRDLVLKLTPKKPSAQYKNLYLVVSKTDFHVTQSVIIDSSNNSNHFQFYAPDFKKPVKADWFEFDEKKLKNYRIVDADRAASTSAKKH